VVASLSSFPASSGSGDDRAVGQAMELVTQVRRDFQARDDLYRYIDQVVYGDIDYQPPKGYRKLHKPQHNPLAVYFTNTITAALTVNPPAVQFPVTGVGDAAQTNATLREHFFDASWERQEDEAEAPIFRRFTHSVVCKGEGVLKTVPRSRTAWSDYTDYAKTLTGPPHVRRPQEALDRREGPPLLVQDRGLQEDRRALPDQVDRRAAGDVLLLARRGRDHPRRRAQARAVPRNPGPLRPGPRPRRPRRPAGDGPGAPARGLALRDERHHHPHDERAVGLGPCRYLLRAGPDGVDLARQAGQPGAQSFNHRYGDPVTKSLRGPYAHCFGTTTASRLPERAGLGVCTASSTCSCMLDELLTIQQINAS
jgi:hypothetical protein